MALWVSTHFDAEDKLVHWTVESGDVLTPNLTEASQRRLDGMKSAQQRNTFLAVRCILENYGLSDFDLFYDKTGRPFLKNGKYISISHSGDHAVVFIGSVEWGIDIEKVSFKAVKAQAHFIQDEVVPIGFEPEALTIIWAVKEAIFKISDSRNLNFKTDLHVRPFTIGEVGEGTAFSTFPDWEVEFNFWYERIDEYVLVGAGRVYDMVGIV
jgi:4'-phosphopantetheinyl transferase